MAEKGRPRVWKVTQEGINNDQFIQQAFEDKKVYVRMKKSIIDPAQPNMYLSADADKLMNDIQIGDFIIVPRAKLHAAFLGQVTSESNVADFGIVYTSDIKHSERYHYRDIKLISELGNFKLQNVEESKWTRTRIEEIRYESNDALLADFVSEDKVKKLVEMVTEYIGFSDWCFEHNNGEYLDSRAKKNKYITGKRKSSNNSNTYINSLRFGWSYNVNGAGKLLWTRGYVNHDGYNIVYDRDNENNRKLKIEFYVSKSETNTLKEIELGSQSPNQQQIKETVIDFWKNIENHMETSPVKKVNDEIRRYQNKYSAKLLESKNIIFRGAPGTGKSYLAKEIASDIVSNGVTQDYKKLSDKQRQQIEFVQFHPSYDYTDFVEGLRPKTNDDGTMGFELQDGVFKQFVAKALKTQNISVDNFDETWEKLMTKLDEEDYLEIPSLQGDKTFPIELNSTGAGLTTRSYRGEYGDGEWLQGHSRYYSKEQLYNIYRGLPGVPHRGHDNYRRAIVQYMENHLDLKKYRPSKNKNNQPYVFIIDEINRGEISKIFGELFFSIDPGYRGRAGEVATQYANLHENPDEKFFIPDNVYIIGTMNDIDRSVDSFDFAMRRRFRFIEIKADERLDMLDILGDKKDKAVWRMTALNQAISTVAELNENYFIGASYFLKTQRLTFDQLWSDYLAPLLQDYVRGMFDETGIMQKFYDAYNSPATEMGDSDGKTAD